MLETLKTIGWILLVILLAITVSNVVSGIFIAIETPIYFTQGMHVTELTDETALVEGRVCQVTHEGIVSFTGANGSKRWWRPNPGIPVATQSISVIFPDGNQQWVKEADLVPYEANYPYCSDTTLPTP